MSFFALCLGRVLLALFFLITVLHEVMNWGEVEQVLLTALTNWMNVYYNYPVITSFLIELSSWASILLAVGVGLKMIGGIFLAFGWYPRLGAFALILCLLPSTFLLHDFWHLQGVQRQLHTFEFLKDMGLLGGLFIVLGAKSLIGKGSD